MKSGIRRSGAKSPPPMTLPARTLAMPTVLSGLLAKKERRYAEVQFGGPLARL
jgi:hypothetical protein